MHFEHIFLLLFGVAAAVALLTRRIGVPYTVALVIAGLILESGHLFRPPTLTKEVLYAVFLPGLLFEAAFHLDFANFRESHRTILGLAVPGLVLAVLATAGLLLLGGRFVPGVAIGVPAAVVFGALIAATDPIAVIGTFKHLGAPRRLALIVESESLLNDGTAVVVFTLALGVASGQTQSVGALVVEFIRVVGAGAIVGAVVGWLASRVTMRVDEAMVEITLTTIAAYGSFAVAEHFHFSGVIAVVVAGMVCGNYGAVHGMSPATKVAVEAFWQYVAFALNSAVFLLIGFQVRPLALLHLWKPILVTYLAVTLARWIAVHIVTIALARSREAVPQAWRWVLSWGGLRGGLSMVLALSLPLTMPHRELLVNLTFGVVFLSIVGQGMTMAPLLRFLGLEGAREPSSDDDLRRGNRLGILGALTALDTIERTGEVDPATLTRLRERYEERLLETIVGSLEADPTSQLDDALSEGVVTPELHRRLVRAVGRKRGDP